MPRYRSTLSERELNYSDSGGPLVGPGEEFEHEIPAAQLASHVRAGFIVPVPPANVDKIHEHATRDIWNAISTSSGKP